MLIAPKWLKLRTSNLTHEFPGTVRIWHPKFFPKRGVFKNLLGGDMHSHERLLVFYVLVFFLGYFVYGFQYQRSWLPGKIYLRFDVLCEVYSFTSTSVAAFVALWQQIDISSDMCYIPVCFHSRVRCHCTQKFIQWQWRWWLVVTRGKQQHLRYIFHSSVTDLEHHWLFHRVLTVKCIKL